MGMFTDFVRKQEEEARKSEKLLNLPKKRMYAEEREAYMMMNICRKFIEDISTTLNKRYEMAGITAMMEETKTNIKKGLTKVYYTIPEDQRRMIDNNAQNATLAVGVRTPGSLGVKNADPDFGVCISFKDMATMVECLKDHCLTCMGSPQDQESCELRKVYDRLGVDAEHINGECAYRGLI